MIELKKQIKHFNSKNSRGLKIEPIDAATLTQLTTPSVVSSPVIAVPVQAVQPSPNRKMFLSNVMGALGGNGGAGAGIAGAGAGLLMAKMGEGDEKKEIKHKEKDLTDSEFGLLMFAQNRHKGLTQVEGEVGRRGLLTCRCGHWRAIWTF